MEQKSGTSLPAFGETFFPISERAKLFSNLDLKSYHATPKREENHRSEIVATICEKKIEDLPVQSKSRSPVRARFVPVFEAENGCQIRVSSDDNNETQFYEIKINPVSVPRPTTSGNKKRCKNTECLFNHNEEPPQSQSPDPVARSLTPCLCLEKKKSNLPKKSKLRNSAENQTNLRTKILSALQSSLMDPSFIWNQELPQSWSMDPVASGSTSYLRFKKRESNLHKKSKLSNSAENQNNLKNQILSLQNMDPLFIWNQELPQSRSMDIVALGSTSYSRFDKKESKLYKESKLSNSAENQTNLGTKILSLRNTLMDPSFIWNQELPQSQSPDPVARALTPYLCSEKKKSNLYKKSKLSNSAENQTNLRTKILSQQNTDTSFIWDEELPQSWSIDPVALGSTFYSRFDKKESNLYKTKKFDCPECGALLSSKSSVKRHVTAVHSKEPKIHPMNSKLHSKNSKIHSKDSKIKSYVCEICGENFANETFFTRHLETHTVEDKD